MHNPLRHGKLADDITGFIFLTSLTFSIYLFEILLPHEMPYPTYSELVISSSSDGSGGSGEGDSSSDGSGGSGDTGLDGLLLNGINSSASMANNFTELN